MEDDEDEQEFAWEKGFQRSWEELTENEKGELRLVSEKKKHGKKKKKDIGHIRRTLARNVYLILDLSKAMSLTDMKPSRFMAMKVVVEKFFRSFFEQNPLSQIGIIGTKNSIAEKISDLGASISKHVNILNGLVEKPDTICIGEVSLQNALELCISSLK